MFEVAIRILAVYIVLILSKVQPGKSFHSVEEVVVDTDANGRQRLSISGWFHASQPDEEDYEPDHHREEAFSSLKQLVRIKKYENDLRWSD